MSEFKVGDLVRFKKVKGMVWYCEEGTILRVIRVDPYVCTIVFGAWTEEYVHWPLTELALFFAEELEHIHE